MKRSRFSEEQIIGILKEHEAGVSVADLCRKLESAAKAGALDGQGELVDRIEDELARVTGELERIREEMRA